MKIDTSDGRRSEGLRVAMVLMAAALGGACGVATEASSIEVTHHSLISCTPGNRAACSWMGACNAAGNECVCDDPQHWWASENCSAWHASPPPTPGQTCTPGDQAFCNWMGACDSSGTGCVCSDTQHRWASDRCSTWHAGPPITAGQACVPGDQAFCSWMGACNASGTGCVCSDTQHRWASDRCSTWHAGPPVVATYPVNVAKGRPIVDTSGSVSGFGPGNAVDGTTTTYWYSNAGTGDKWITVDLGSPRTIRRWVVKQAASGEPDNIRALNLRGFGLQFWNGTSFEWADRIDGNNRAIADRDVTPVTSRYFSIRIYDNPDDGGAARVREFELYEQHLNLAFQKPATANSNVPGETPALAVDGSVSDVTDDNFRFIPNSKWCAVGAGAKWLAVDLGAPTAVIKWVVHHAGSGGETARWNTQDFQLQGRLGSGDPWVMIDGVAGNVANTTNRSLSEPVTYRYFRLYISNAGADGAARIYDLQLYGPEVFTNPSQTYVEAGWPDDSDTLTLMSYDNDVTIYFDRSATTGVDPQGAAWVHGYTKYLWNRIRNQWGQFGLTNRMVIRAHQDPGGGFLGKGGMHYNYNLFENFVDVRWSGTWDDNQYVLKRILAHEVGHIIQESHNEMQNPGGSSPVANLWGDGGWIDILVYDNALASGNAAEIASAWAEASGPGRTNDLASSDGTVRHVQWFNDFFLPIYTRGDGIAVYVRYYQICRQFFTKNDRLYYDQRGMNVGELVHFMSAAAGFSVKSYAQTAFTPWAAEWESQYQQARVDFSQLNSYY